MKKFIQFFSIALLGAALTACHDNDDTSNAGNIIGDLNNGTSVVITATTGNLLNPAIAGHTGKIGPNVQVTLTLPGAAAASSSSTSTTSTTVTTVKVNKISVTGQFANTTAAALGAGAAVANTLELANATFGYDSNTGLLTLTLGDLALGTTNDVAGGTGVADPAGNLAARTIIFSGLSKKAGTGTVWTAQAAVGTNGAGAEPKTSGATGITLTIN